METTGEFHKYLVIVAGGKGTRMGSPVPKQFLAIAGRPIIMLAIDRFVSVYPEIEVIVVLGPGLTDRWKELCLKHNFTTPHSIAIGGAERFDSVKNGINRVSRHGLVAIHDAVRPFVSNDTIERCFDEAAKYGNAIPVTDLRDSVRETGVGVSSRPFDRKKLKLVQTPQVFRSDILFRAYSAPFNKAYTDDATVVEAMGETIRLVDGNPENIKITTPSDLVLGEAIFASSFHH